MSRSAHPLAPEDPVADLKAMLRQNPEWLRGDPDLLSDLGLRLVPGGNVVEFAPMAVARAEAAKVEALTARQELEEAARANFAAQAQTHAAVVDLLDSRNLSDLARRVDECARLRFGLAAGAIAIEQPGAVPLGWRPLEALEIDRALGASESARLDAIADDGTLFESRAPRVASAALVRMSIWAPERSALLCFGAADPHGFTPEMGAELVAFLARVVERVAERWPTM